MSIKCPTCQQAVLRVLCVIFVVRFAVMPRFQMQEKARAARNIVLRVQHKPLWQVINVINAARVNITRCDFEKRE